MSHLMVKLVYTVVKCCESIKAHNEMQKENGHILYSETAPLNEPSGQFFDVSVTLSRPRSAAPECDIL